MHAVELKLTFPSMEDLVAYLTANKGAVVSAPAVKVEQATPAPKPKAEKTASPPAAAVSSQPATDAASPASSPAVSESAPAGEVVEYAVLQKAVFTLAGKSRDAAAAVAASFGVKTFKELDSTRWAEALAAVNAKIAEA